MLVSVDQLEASAKRYGIVNQGVSRNNIPAVSEEILNENVPPGILTGNILTTNASLVKRKEMLRTVKKEPVDFAFERAIGKNDSVYSNFVELILSAKRKVGRIAIKQGANNIGFATGFMVAENIMLTNWHVFQTKEDVADSEIQFNYELNILGDPADFVSFKFRNDIFYYSNKDLDYCFVAVNPLDLSGKTAIKDMGYIFLDPSLGKLGSEDEEALNIIHHPDGDYKQLSIRENLFVKITPISIWYKTDTAPGSSGSPVFNDQWQAVALHHMGVGRKNDEGEYIDKDGNVIPNINGRIDASKIVWDANEGIRISVILNDVFTSHPENPVLKSMQIKPANEGVSTEALYTPQITKPLNNLNMEPNNSVNTVSISFPASLVEKNGSINININQGVFDTAVKSNTGKNVFTSATMLVPDADEVKKLEGATDFSGCKGYQSGFLANSLNIALPQPKSEIRKFIAKVSNTDSLVLKYYNYSTIFHSVRMMPIISGINVDGDLGKRLDKATRKDIWLRDSRLSYDIQLSDSYYSGSHFDRGHMSRREDADWGATPEEAKRNADLTCMYTNACPQVPKINQSSKKGLWGILEKVVLESGAEAEKRDIAKISVFNGPIFKDDDPVFRGIQVPMDFYKIVLWLTDTGKLKATAFKLSQQKSVSNIDFEELDIDQNTEFKEYQCSIASLEESTKIDFSGILSYDTFDGSEDADKPINSALDVMAHINKHNSI